MGCGKLPMRAPSSLYVYVSSPHPSTSECMHQSICEICYVYHGNWGHLNDVLHKSIPSVLVSMCLSLPSLQGNLSVKFIPPFGARQRLCWHVPAATNIRNKGRIVGHFIFYAVRVLAKDCLCAFLCIPISLLGNNSVKMFPRQRRIVEGVVFYAVHIVSNECRRLVILRTSC
jgi:hypothetical protein